jgi:quinoprotein glucose dehydrogenase
MAWHPESGRMLVADHGPSGEFETYGYDRILVIEPGKHHGWPAVIGAAGREEYVDPILVFEAGAPPGDLAFFEGDLMMSTLGFSSTAGHALLRVRLESSGGTLRPVALERWFNDEQGNSVYGRLRGLAVGPDGALYIGTSNRDERSMRRDRADHIFRLRAP